MFVIADDLTFRDLGCYGGQASTPHIDHLATEGMRLTRCFQAAPMCSPTRHNIYTGLYPVSSGAYPNHAFAKPGTKSIVHHLRPLGYRVALSGKKHIAPRDVFPFEYLGKKNNPDMDAIDRLFAESKQAKTPFCLFACSNEPHTPWNKGDASRYPPARVKLPPYIVDTPLVRENFSRYLAEITYFDDQVGQILAKLKQHDLQDSTMVMVVSEQGNAFPFAKWTCYGHGLQSAMIVRWPGRIEAGSESDALVEYTDIAPTFIEAAGGKVPDVLEGESLLPVLLGKRSTHKQFVYGEMTTRGIINGADSYPIRTVRDDRYRLIWNLNHDAKFTNACTQSELFKSMVAKAERGDAKAAELVRKYQHRPQFELFDCQRDPLEMHNLADDPNHSDHLERLHQQLQAWMKSQGDQGVQTELDAIFHQAKNARKPREQVRNAYEAKQAGNTEKPKPNGRKRDRRRM